MKWNIFKNRRSRYGFIGTVLLSLVVCVSTSCMGDYPVDDDGLLITRRGECYVSSFNLIGTDAQSVLTTSVAVDTGIDTVACTITAAVYFGTDLTNLYPRFSLVTDALVEPKVTGYEDFSSMTRQWTVVSGNRKVRKTYTINLSIHVAPTNFRATAGNAQVALTWDTPYDDGRAITKYQISYDTTERYTSTGYVVTWADIPSSNAGTTSHTVTGLTNGTGYTFEIRAVYAISNGVSSGRVAATPVAPPTP